MTGSAEKELQTAINNFFSWIVVQSENLNANHEIHLGELGHHLQIIENLTRGRQINLEMAHEFTRMHEALQRLIEKVTFQKNELEENMQKISHRAQGISRYMKAAASERA